MTDSHNNTDVPQEWKQGQESDKLIDWRGNLTNAESGSFESHPLHQLCYPLSLAVLKWCQKLITSAESTVNDDGEVEFRSWPSIETLCDIRKHCMAVSAKLAGGLSSENRDKNEADVSLEFLGMAHAHMQITIALFRLLLLERVKDAKRDNATKQIVADFLQRAQYVIAELENHAERLTRQFPTL